MASRIPKEVTLEREARVWELRQQLWTHERIAAELGVDRSTVTKILGRLSARYAKSLAAHVEEVKGEQIAGLYHIADEAMQAWERSKLDAETTTTKTTTIKGEGDDALTLPAEETTHRLQGQTGTPAYLTAAMAALADIRKILSLDAPARNEVTGKDGAPLAAAQILIYIPDNARDHGNSPAAGTAGAVSQQPG